MNRSEYKTLSSELRSKRLDGAVLWPPSMTLSDPLQRRAEMAESIRNCAVGGYVIFEVTGTDCDGFGYEQEHEIPATLMHYLTEVASHERWADGPYCASWRKPNYGDLHCEMCSGLADAIVHSIPFCERCAKEVS